MFPLFFISPTLALQNPTSGFHRRAKGMNSTSKGKSETEPHQDDFTANMTVSRHLAQTSCSSAALYFCLVFVKLEVVSVKTGDKEKQEISCLRLKPTRTFQTASVNGISHDETSGACATVHSTLWSLTQSLYGCTVYVVPYMQGLAVLCLVFNTTLGVNMAANKVGHEPRDQGR